MTKTDYLLKEWGAWFVKNLDWPNLLGENILYRAGILSGRVQEGMAGHRVLCPDCPTLVRKVDRAVSTLNESEREAITLWYCLPSDQETGKPLKKHEVAKLAGISKDALTKRLTRARKKVEKHLTTV